MAYRDDDTASLVQLRAYLNNSGIEAGARLPPERTLAELIGVSRPLLRKALLVLEKEGRIWRHVGKGTFVGNRPVDTPVDITHIAGNTSPFGLMQARLLLEPEFAAFAATNASPAHIEELRATTRRSREVRSWREYETTDNEFHRLIVEASQNGLLLGLMDVMQAVGRTVTWGRVRSDDGGPPADHHSFAEHEAVVESIARRDAQGAREAMEHHLQSVGRKLLRPVSSDR
jgi:DNA-binding FadR family transcriptional regulator